MPEIACQGGYALQHFDRSADMEMMNEPSLKADAINGPRWTIKRDTRSIGCIFCLSIIVCVTTETRQMAFCSCRLVEYRLLPRLTARMTDRGSR